MVQCASQKTSNIQRVLLVTTLAIISLSLPTTSSSTVKPDSNTIDDGVLNYIDEIFDQNSEIITLAPGIVIKKEGQSAYENVNSSKSQLVQKRDLGLENYFLEKWDRFSKNHVLNIRVPQSARLFAFGTGKSSFLAGFGMGFLAFFLKKLLLPVFIVAQIFKSVLIAMFLPSILGSLGKLVGKGLSTVSGVSGSSNSGFGNQNNQIEDFEFKDTSPYNNENDNFDQEAHADNSFNVNTIETTTVQQAMNRYGFVNQRVSVVTQSPLHSETYYFKKPQKTTDYKVFHRIPSSSILLTSYDPFYSPLLSRLDSVFQQLGLGNSKSPETEKCRERLVCMMYANPAKYAPYSNLVSAQLSRELNELKKPTSDNPDILRFFKYMKAAKDGQDGEECLEHQGCPSLASQQPSPAMLTTFNDINKLVQARNLR